MSTIIMTQIKKSVTIGQEYRKETLNKE